MFNRRRFRTWDFTDPETVQKVVSAQGTFVAKLGGGKNPSKKLAKAFAEYDSDGSGSLDAGEFRKACKLVLGARADKTADLIFKFIDEDGGGSLDQVEFFRFLGFDQCGRPLAFNPLHHLLAVDAASGGTSGQRGLDGALYRMWNAVLRWSGGGIGVVGAAILLVRGAFVVHDPQRKGYLAPERFEAALRALPGYALLSAAHVKELKQRHLDTDDEGRRVVNYDEFVHAIALDDDAVVDVANDFRLQVRSSVERGGEDARKKIQKALKKLTSGGKALTGVSIQESLKKYCDVRLGTRDIRALAIGCVGGLSLHSVVRSFSPDSLLPFLLAFPVLPPPAAPPPRRSDTAALRKCRAP